MYYPWDLDFANQEEMKQANLTIKPNKKRSYKSMTGGRVSEGIGQTIFLETLAAEG
jgi:hypothetical protein